MATPYLSKSIAFHYFFTIFLFLSISILTNTINAIENHEDKTFFVKTMDPNLINSQPEKLTHFKFYFHDIASGKSPSSITVVLPLNNSATYFGMIDIMDNALTVGPEISSKMVGRAQGLYAGASQEEIAVFVTLNFAFIEDKYNGSTITVTGRNPVLQTGEMPVVGGSGVFRFARGYARAKTYSPNFKTVDFVVEYNLYVLHY